jgi:hypothetical protein
VCGISGSQVYFTQEGRARSDTNQLTRWSQYPQAHHCIYKSPPPAPILSQLDPLYTLPAKLPKIHSDCILPSTPWSSKRSLSFWLSLQNPVHIHVLSHACHMSRPPPFPWFDLPSNIWGWIQNMKLLIVQLPPFSCYFSPSGQNIFLRTLFSNTLSLCSDTLIWIKIYQTHLRSDEHIRDYKALYPKF